MRVKKDLATQIVFVKRFFIHLYGINGGLLMMFDKKTIILMLFHEKVRGRLLQPNS